MTTQEGIGRKSLLRCVLGHLGSSLVFSLGAFRLAFASGLGTAGRGKKLCVKFGCWRKDCKEVFKC